MSVVSKYSKKIKSAKNIAKITKAMQMVAASKMKKAEKQAVASKAYSEEVYNFSKAISPHADPYTYKLMSLGNKNGKTIVLLIAPEKGLCGSLITNLFKKVMELIESKIIINPEFIIVGKKGEYIVKRVGGQIDAAFHMGFSQPSYEIVPPISRHLIEKFLSGNYSQVVVVYPEFLNVMGQEARYKILLPLEFDTAKSTEKFSFEPGIEDIFESFFAIYLENQIYQQILEGFASEQAARMVAMKNATDNAKVLIDDLTLEFNKSRQTLITSEIIDVSNAASMLVAN